MATACIAHRLGWLLIILAAVMALPMLLCLMDETMDAAAAFFFGAFVTVFIGVALIIAFRQDETAEQNWVAVVSVGLAWIVIPAFAGLPLLGLVPQFTLLDAYFEALSALTTTGASLLPAHAFPDAAALANAALEKAAEAASAAQGLADAGVAAGSDGAARPETGGEPEAGASGAGAPVGTQGQGLADSVRQSVAPGGNARALVVWLALLEWMGGAGALAVACGVFAPLLWSGIPLLTTPMPRHTGTFMNRLLAMVTLILPVYTALTAIFFMALLMSGLPVVDAFCFALSGISTGGFSPVASGGIAGYDIPLAPVFLALSMAAGGASITVHWSWMNRRGAACLNDVELRFYLAGLLVAVGLAVALWLWFGPGESVGEDDGLPGMAPLGGSRFDLGALGAQAFLGISLLTTTGWTVDGDVTGHGLPLSLILGLPAIGAMALSTAGGLKLLRVVLLFKHANRELERLAHPNGVARVKFAGTRIETPVLARTGAVFMAFIVAVGALTLAVAAHGLEFETAIAASLSVLSNTGPAFDLAVEGRIGFADLPEGARVLLCLGMVLGRVEVLALLSLLNPAYWRQ